MDPAVRRVVLVAGLAAAGALAAVAAGSGRGPGGGSDTGPSVPSSSVAPNALPATTAPPTSKPRPMTTTPPVNAVAVERALVEGLPGPRDDAVIADAATTSEGRSIVVGRVENAATGTVRPFALVSQNGRSWARADLPLGAYVSGEASAAGGPIAAGTVRATDGRAAIASWVRNGRRWRGPFVTEPTGTASVSVTDVDTGPAGAVVLARTAGTSALWLSADGRLWNAAPQEWNVTRHAVAVAVGDVVVVLTHRQDERGVVHTGVLVGRIGEPLEPLTRPFGPPGRVLVSDVVWTAGGFVAVGGVRAAPDGDFEPAVWRSPDGRAWRRARSALPPLAGADGSRGTALDFVDAGPAGIVVASDAGRMWRAPDGRRFMELPAQATSTHLVAVAATPAPAAVSTSRLDSFVGGRWTTPARRQLPTAAAATRLNGVTYLGGAWYAVGERSRPSERDADGITSEGIVLRSADGRRWEQVAGDRDLAGLTLAAVTAADGRLVAVGTGTDGAKDGAGQMLHSPDGGRWRRLALADLTRPEGGTHELESVAAGPAGGAVATGLASDGDLIRPLVLHMRADGAVDRPARGLNVAPGDVLTLAVCTSDDVALVAGAVGGATLAAPGWISRNLRRWRPIDLAPLARVDACAGSGDGRFVAAGRPPADDGARTAAIAGRPGAFTAIEIDDDVGLPNGIAMSNDGVVIVGEEGSDGVVWIGDDRAVRRVELADLTAPGSQVVNDVAIAGDRAVMVGAALGQAAIWVLELK